LIDRIRPPKSLAKLPGKLTKLEEIIQNNQILICQATAKPMHRHVQRRGEVEEK
jgi:hypothetical protein